MLLLTNQGHGDVYDGFCSVCSSLSKSPGYPVRRVILRGPGSRMAVLAGCLVFIITVATTATTTTKSAPQATTPKLYECPCCSRTRAVLEP